MELKDGGATETERMRKKASKFVFRDNSSEIGFWGMWHVIQRKTLFSAEKIHIIIFAYIYR